MLALLLCAGRACADEESVVKAFERLGAVVKRDDAKPGKPVIALRFGLRNPIPDTTADLDRDVLFVQLQSQDLGTPNVERIKGADADRKNEGKTFDPFCPTAIKVTDGDLKEVSQLAHLQVLDLSYSEITNEGLPHLGALKQLHTLDLRNTRIDDAGLQILKEFKNLKRLYLTNCPVTDKGLVHLRELPDLEELFLRGGKEVWEKGVGASIPPYFELWCWKNEVTDKGMASLKELKNLQKLYLNGYRLTDEGLRELKEITNLRELTLDVTEVTDEGLTHLSRLKRLEKLSLESTKVTDAGLKHLSGLDRLETLDLCRTQVTDEGMKTLQKLNNLRRLSLAFTQVTEKGLKELNRFKRLEHADLPGSFETRADATAQAKAKKALPKLEFVPIYQFPVWYEKFCQQRQERFQQEELPALQQAWLQQQHLPQMPRPYSPPVWLKFLQDHPVLGLASPFG
jgi:Leucine-rich repeat (LRR) protein